MTTSNPRHSTVISLVESREGCPSLHPQNIGRPNAAKHLDEALRYILGHDGVWTTTADDIAEYYLANHYDPPSRVRT
jgi:hypothetical protein